jgi:vesicle coat complex subunit
VVKQLSKLLQDVTVPKARAAIVWVIGEYHQHVPLLAPDVLRILAKSFTEEVHPTQHILLSLFFSFSLTYACVDRPRS